MNKQKKENVLQAVNQMNIYKMVNVLNNVLENMLYL